MTDGEKMMKKDLSDPCLSPPTPPSWATADELWKNNFNGRRGAWVKIAPSTKSGKSPHYSPLFGCCPSEALSELEMILLLTLSGGCFLELYLGIQELYKTVSVEC